MGLGALFLAVNEDFAPDINYLSGQNSFLSTQTLAHLSVLKSVSSHELLGVTAQYGLISSDASYGAIGVQYQHYFEPKGSHTFYLPLSLAYSQTDVDSYYSSTDTTYFPGGGMLYPTDVQGRRTFSAVETNLGLGILRALKNDKSVSLEWVLFRQFGTSKEHELQPEPQSNFQLSGLKFLLTVGF